MLLHADDFKGYGTNVAYLLNGVYAEANDVAIVDDPQSAALGKVARFGPDPYGGAGSFAKARKVLPAAVATVGVSGRFWLTRLPTSINELPLFAYTLDNLNNKQIIVGCNPSGQIVAYNNGVLIGTSANPAITANGWYHIESKIVHSAVGTGTVEVRVEGVPVLVLNALTTPSPTAQQVNVGVDPSAISSAPGVYLKDYVIWDGTGARNNDFLGSVLVIGLDANADVAAPWTLTGAATAYDILNNSPPQDGVQYASAPYPGIPAAIEVGLSNMPANISSVKGIFTRVRAQKTDGGDGQLQVSMRSAGVDHAGADRPITAAFLYWDDLHETDPATGAAWLPGAVDAATLKINRTL